MDSISQPTIYLADYTPPTYLIDKVHLIFRLHPTATRVKSRIEFRPNPATQAREFFLHGHDLTLLSATVDGQPCRPEITADGLRIAVPDAPFIWECEVEISPQTNTALTGLYMSNGMYCTQCEAEGFRRITYYPDRPDVMAVFDVRIQSDQAVLLSNGNPGASGQGWAQWHDPWPKPAYLFALVAGDLVAHPGAFTTRSGRAVALNIWVRKGDENKCAFAMQSLIKSMQWDEKVYGREYDLDLFNIVAVDDFNMGAMENKGLNIFNSSVVLASPETATDSNYQRIEAIIAHEYFHNWTGNRITCRDWFQLCLKEGLTVFRDQQFSADLRGRAVKRIDDAVTLRAAQFREDAGPLAHSVRPESFVEINNFYTTTIYEKGAEVIGMLKRLVGDAAYGRALALYFERHDGDAATIEDWLRVFTDTTGRDLSQFKRWYSQAGTPRISVSDDFRDGTYTLHLKQQTPATPGQDHKDPLLIPVAVGLMDPNGDEVLATSILELRQAEQSFEFHGLDRKPIPSILRDFSAPAILTGDVVQQHHAFLLANDTDPFNKWQAGHALGKATLAAMLTRDAAPDPAYLDALAQIALDTGLDPALRARMLQSPGQDDMAQTLHDTGQVPDPVAIQRACAALELALAHHLSDDLAQIYADMATPGRYSPDADAVARRALRAAALTLLSRLDGGTCALAQFNSADNMTDQLGAFCCLVPTRHGANVADRFYQQWRGDRLVVDKWFSTQIAFAAPQNTMDVARHLAEHPDFDWKNPNRLRALLGAFSQANPAGFHSPDGAGYRFYADWMIRVDPLNPQMAARLVGAFAPWRRYHKTRQDLIRAQLQRIAQTENLSTDTAEMLARILAD